MIRERFDFRRSSARVNSISEQAERMSGSILGRRIVPNRRHHMLSSILTRDELNADFRTNFPQHKLNTILNASNGMNHVRERKGWVAEESFLVNKVQRSLVPTDSTATCALSRNARMDKEKERIDEWTCNALSGKA